MATTLESVALIPGGSLPHSARRLADRAVRDAVAGAGIEPAGVLTALQIADGFLSAGTIRHAVIVASDADPGHGLAPGFPYDPVGAALVCGWDSGESGLAGNRRRQGESDERTAHTPG